MGLSEGLPDYAVANRADWTKANAEFADRHAREAWAQTEVTWGLFGYPEHEVGLLGEVAGLDVVELGCGTAYFSAWLARQGARPVGVDVTPAQLESARRCQQEFGLAFPLLEANAERVPLPDESFDLAFSEYGASIWCDPYLWIPEAYRLLRPGGRLVFLCNSPLAILCSPDAEEPAGERLVRPQRGLHRMDWSDGCVDFHLGHGEMMRLLRETRFELEALVELFAAEDAEAHEHYGSYMTVDWARMWPAEELWAARKPG